jgi:hypothetical protein
MARTIILRIHADGRVEGRTEGIKGKACVEYLAPLEELCQARIVACEHTPEYHEQEDDHVVRHDRARLHEEDQG